VGRKIIYIVIALLLVSIAAVVLINFIPSQTTIEDEMANYEDEFGEITSLQIVQESNERSDSSRREVVLEDRDEIMALFEQGNETELVSNDRAPTVNYHLEIETTEHSVYTAPTIIVSDVTFAYGESRFHVNGTNFLLEAIETGDFDWDYDE